MKYLIKKYALKNAYEHEGEAQVKPVMNKVLGEKPELKEDMSKLGREVNEVVEEVNQMPKKKQERKLIEMYPEALEQEEEEEEIPELPGDTSEVVMRFAPYPSGPLHIGHARQAVLNNEYAKEKNDGKFYLVIDDTIGSEEKNVDPEAYEMIKEDMKWLGLDYDEVHLKSERLEKYYKWAKKLIDRDKAYVCNCSAEELRKNREEGEECSHRTRSVSENKEEFQKMLEHEYTEGEAVLRIKTDMEHKDPAFRDRVIMRISEREHPKTGSEYHVWPLLDFSWAVDDHLLGMTHILRGKDLLMETKMEKYIWDCLDIDHSDVEFIHTGRLNLEGQKISTSTSKKKIKQGEYHGWEDPRTWSIRSLRKRGITPEGIRNFIINNGVSESSSTVPLNSLYSENRKVIDSETRRFFFVPTPVELKVKGTPELDVDVPMHPQEDLGKKEYSFGSGEETFLVPREDFKEKEEGDKVRLKGAFSIKIKENTGDYIESRFNTTELQEDVTDVVQWVTEDSFPVSVTLPNADIEKGQGEKHLEKTHENEVIQFERYGFVKINKKNKEIKTSFAHR